ncbi:MAG: hypothetical protein WC622_13695 [Pedobacter sp.]|jgi:hypothetical protein|uniref:hypothetical protein n=1 Tax=Pedobacter sp. TaxID=1411316 RepID=UPI003567CFDB
MKTIKKTAFIICLLTAFTLVYVSCKKDSLLDLSGTYTIKSGETLNLSKGGGRASLTIEELTDTRCPINALCVTGGYASGKFKFKDNFKTQTVELCLNGMCATETSQAEQKVTLNGITYSVTFTDLTPFPTYPAQNKVATATLMLKRK